MTTTVAVPVSRLKFFAISWFAVVMGLGGTAVAWHKADKVLAIGLPIGAALGYVAVAAFVAIAAIYLLKAQRHPDAVAAEFAHPIRLSFFPAFSISLILLSVVFMEAAPRFAFWLWAVGVPIQLGLSLYVITAWIRQDIFQVQHSNPAWFIPVVGNILVPVAGVAFAPAELSWFFFSVGLFFWLALFTLILNRMLFHGMMPERLIPTLFILIAPPAVAFISYLRLTGELDNFARILYYLAVFFTLLVFMQWRLFAKLEFYLSWWAGSFPMAALTVATFLMFETTGQTFFAGLGGVFLAILSGLVVLLIFLTARGVASGTICVEEK